MASRFKNEFFLCNEFNREKKLEKKCTQSPQETNSYRLSTLESKLNWATKHKCQLPGDKLVSLVPDENWRAQNFKRVLKW